MSEINEWHFQNSLEHRYLDPKCSKCNDSGFYAHTEEVGDGKPFKWKHVVTHECECGIVTKQAKEEALSEIVLPTHYHINHGDACEFEAKWGGEWVPTAEAWKPIKRLEIEVCMLRAQLKAAGTLPESVQNLVDIEGVKGALELANASANDLFRTLIERDRIIIELRNDLNAHQRAIQAVKGRRKQLNDWYDLNPNGTVELPYIIGVLDEATKDV